MSKNIEVGIIGLPNIGKSTLFNAITNNVAEAANYPFCTIEPNIGIVKVPDVRLEQIAKIYKTKKILPTVIKFVDIAGLAKGASSGEGLGNKFLSHIRQVDAIIQVVRGFKDDNIIHIEGDINPYRDIEIINTELCLADLDSINKRIDRIKKIIKSGDKKADTTKNILIRLEQSLNNTIPARKVNLTLNEKILLKDLNLLTLKPILYVININEKDLTKPEKNKYVQQIIEYARNEQTESVIVAAKFESEIRELDNDEVSEFLVSIGIEMSGIKNLINASYRLLGLITFITAGEKEVKAWTVQRGTKAPQAGGKIHSDIERGFIRAEVISYTDLIKAGAHSKAKEKGLIRLEGKEYIMKDGDITHFRFNV